MKKNSTLDSSFLSPVRGSTKHRITPLRTRYKTSRKDREADVHTLCSTPNRVQLDNVQSGFNSPDSYPCSQDHRPDVVWDYTSPKLSKGSKKREIKITVEEFLKNLSNQQGSSNTQSSQYIKLLENWMTKQSVSDVAKKPIGNRKDQSKKRSRRVKEEIKQFMESIQKQNEEKSNREKNVENEIKQEIAPKLFISKDKKSFLEENSENDSSDELWGDADNSFIVKATQQLEFSCFDEANNKNSDFISSIPETVSNNLDPPNHKSKLIAREKNLNDSDYQAQLLLSQIINCDWNSDSDDNDWENGFIEDDALSLIPDEVLSGSQSNEKCDLQPTTSKDTKDVSSYPANSSSEKASTRVNSEDITFGFDLQPSVSKDTKDVSSHPAKDVSNQPRNSSSGKNSIRVNSEEISFGSNSPELGNGSDAQLFNSFEEESFGDEFILCQPEVLSMIDEVESKMSQSQRCTPEEIERKKDEAINRRRRKSLRKRT